MENMYVMAILKATILLIFLRFVVDTSAEDDTQCLKLFKNSVKDPGDFLGNWNFNNNESQGYLCSFTGVLCWNAQENKVLSLTLDNAGLLGSFPSGLSNCSSLTALSLAGNAFSGAIPSDICKQAQYLTILDLSQNSFGGVIPVNLENCIYLNSLYLQKNKLNGSIPYGIGLLPRLTSLNLSSNLLIGEIPNSFTNRSSIGQKPFGAASFEDNPGLCGPPLQTPCSGGGSS